MDCSRLAIFLVLLLVGAWSGSWADNGMDEQFIQCLEAQFKRSDSSDDVIHTPQNASYPPLLVTENLRPASTSPRKPLLILTPIHESQVQAAVRCSRETGLLITVRSGGHDFEGLSYTSRNPFVIVDMRNLHSVNVDTEDKTAWVEAGATLGQLYYHIAQKSRTLAFPAGVCPTVGVGGHFSGGGYSMMSRQHSIAADHIIDAKLIDAQGRILDRQSMGEDLFWALRGSGGSSFGIVVAFKIELFEVPETVTVFNVTRTLEQNATELVHRWQHVADNIDDRLGIRLFLMSGRAPTGRNRTIFVSFTSLFLGGVKDLLPIMQDKFPQLGLQEQDCIEMSWIESVLFMAKVGDLEILLNRTSTYVLYYKVKSDYVRQPIPISGLTGIWRFLNQAPEMTGEIQFSPYGGAMNTYSDSETPFPHRSGNIFMIEYSIMWENPADSRWSIDWMRRLYSYTARYVSKSPRAAYVNYRDLDIGSNNLQGNTTYAQASVWGRKYFNNNFQRLVRIKTKFDPTNFFRNEQSIPPLTWR